MELEELGLTATEAAARVGLSRRTLSELVNERRRVSPEIALRLGRFLGNGTEIWMNMQTQFDRWQGGHNEHAVHAAERVRPAVA